MPVKTPAPLISRDYKTPVETPIALLSRDYKTNIKGLQHSYQDRLQHHYSTPIKRLQDSYQVRGYRTTTLLSRERLHHYSTTGRTSGK